MPTSRSRGLRSESLHRQVARNIRNDIESGVLRHGQVLPSSRDLAERWGVSVFTISEAMKLLLAEGLIVTKNRTHRAVHAPDQAAQNEVRTRTPQVILIGGFAGSGKTELGRILARETGWAMLDKDTLTRPVVEAALEVLGQSPHDRESETYLQEIRPREYEALLAATTENVECGNSVIVTAPFIKEFADEAWLNRTRAAYTAFSATVTIVWLHCDPETMHTYVRHRGAARDTTKLADWPAYLANIDTDFRPPTPHTVIDNSASSAPLQGQAKDLLRSIVEAAAD